MTLQAQCKPHLFPEEMKEGYLSNAGDDFFFVLFFVTVYFIVSNLSVCDPLFSSELSMTF